MIEVLLAVLIVILLVGGMAIGVLLGRKPIAGSCGGMAALGMKLDCEICGGDSRKCEEFEGAAQSAPEPPAPANAVRLGR
ncbi:MAG TPA: (Na+)-NQR maturation NqrM [Porticoccaceae bacterium]|nr:(Na+)-NQR maturation NqrM [Porticoccaceae bacterium]